MPVLKRRNRVVNFRMSEEEYKNLEQFCISRGARSISEIARSAVFELIDGEEESANFGSAAERMRALQQRVKQLDGEVKRLARLVEGSLSPDSPPNPA